MEIKLLIDSKGTPYLKLIKGDEPTELKNYAMKKFMTDANKSGVEYEMYSPHTGYLKLASKTKIDNIEELTKKVCKIIKNNSCMLGHDYPDDFNDIGQEDMRDLTRNLSKLFKEDNAI